MKFIVAIVVFFLGLVTAEQGASKYLYSDVDMGIYNVTSCTGAPSCGKF
jgi:hypothetical protein